MTARAPDVGMPPAIQRISTKQIRLVSENRTLPVHHCTKKMNSGVSLVQNETYSYE